MNIFTKLSLVLALLVAPALVVAATLTVSITAPANNANVTINQPVSFTASVTGGDPTSANFAWVMGDGSNKSSANNNGSTALTHTYTSLGAKTVVLNVEDFPGNFGTRTITVNVVPATTALAISNIRTTDVTENSVIVRWTTNKPATSRVIFDTVTHANVDTTTGSPNYTYANSTLENQAEVTEHAVTVTGLTANTQYFYRVISETN